MPASGEGPDIRTPESEREGGFATLWLFTFAGVAAAGCLLALIVGTTDPSVGLIVMGVTAATSAIPLAKSVKHRLRQGELEREQRLRYDIHASNWLGEFLNRHPFETVGIVVALGILVYLLSLMVR